MGLLTDPSSGPGRISKLLINYYQKLCFLLYVGGILGFCSLAYREVNNGTYFSENALLPGLVKTEFREDGFARRIHMELLDEMRNYRSSIPYPWLLAKFKQMGLDTYTHNFTLNSPLGRSHKYTGKNVYGILRAAGASSLESLVISVPYRPPDSPHLPTGPSIAMLLAFAKFASRQKYWAKDLIFLITEHEQLGIQAWLEAYHGVTCGTEGVLLHGDLNGRAGAILAALNLEIHDELVAQIDLKVEGLNGQLPNLDLFNLATKLCTKEGLHYTFKNRETKHLKNDYKDWWYSMQTLLAMVATQSTGIPNGNHGLFHRFGIEAITFEGFGLSDKKATWKADYLVIGRILEGMLRSLNNLLERFHQSFFFYLLPSSDRYISIGLYFPALSVIAGALFVKACAKWCILSAENESEPSKVRSSGSHSSKPKESKEKKSLKQLKIEFEKLISTRSSNPPEDKGKFMTVLATFTLAHFIGGLLMNSPNLFALVGESYGIAKEIFVFYGLIVASGASLIIAFCFNLNTTESSGILYIAALLESGTALICVGLFNFSLGLVCAVIYVPFALIITNSPTSRFRSHLQKLLLLLVHPMVVFVLITAAHTFYTFSGESLKTILARSISASQHFIVYSIVDSMIYGNWLFNIVTFIFVSNWLCFWTVCFAPVIVEKPKNKKSKAE